ncbi:hypothetical protein C7212DRAFT_339956, partial [Tuber magnatum]
MDLPRKQTQANASNTNTQLRRINPNPNPQKRESQITLRPSALMTPTHSLSGTRYT